MNKLLKEYNKVDKKKVCYFNMFNHIYDKRPNIDENMLLAVSNLAYRCYLKDKVPLIEYVDYILDDTINSKTKDYQLGLIDPKEIVYFKNHDLDFRELLNDSWTVVRTGTFNVTKDNKKIYSNNEKYIVINDKEEKEKEFSIENNKEIFKLIREKNMNTK